MHLEAHDPKKDEEESSGTKKIENADVRPHACQPPRGLNADAVPALRVPTPAGVEAEELGARDVSATRCAFHSLQAMAVPPETRKQIHLTESSPVTRNSTPMGTRTSNPLGLANA